MGPCLRYLNLSNQAVSHVFQLGTEGVNLKRWLVREIPENGATLESIWRTVLFTVSSSGMKARAMESTAAAPPK